MIESIFQLFARLRLRQLERQQKKDFDPGLSRQIDTLIYFLGDLK